MAKTIRSLGSALTGAVAAVGVMYYFDAGSGQRRRAQLAERSLRSSRYWLSRLRFAGRDLASRAGGVGARAASLLRLREVTPEIVAERVRAAMGRVVSHPGAVQVSVDEIHRVVLRGAVLAWEHAPLCREVLGTPGVRELRDELVAYESAEQVCAPQGGRPRRARELLQDRWSPGTRLLMAVAGGGLLLGGSRLFGGSARRGALGAVGAAAGGALLLRSAVNVPLRDLARGRGRHLEVRKTLRVRGSLAQVFAALCDCESFPAFMRHITEVRRRPDGSTHWVMAGPWGSSLEWDAITTQLEPDRLIAWRTTESSALQHWGLLRLESGDAGADSAEVRVHVYLCYSSPAGWLGHALARALGADARSGLTADLLRLTDYLEHRGAGVASGSTAQGPRPDVGTGTGQSPETLAGRSSSLGTPPASEEALAAWMEPPQGRTH
jgi:uncharacterized membrane protein